MKYFFVTNVTTLQSLDILTGLDRILLGLRKVIFRIINPTSSLQQNIQILAKCLQILLETWNMMMEHCNLLN